MEFLTLLFADCFPLLCRGVAEEVEDDVRPLPVFVAEEMTTTVALQQPPSPITTLPPQIVDKPTPLPPSASFDLDWFLTDD